MIKPRVEGSVRSQVRVAFACYMLGGEYPHHTQVVEFIDSLNSKSDREHRANASLAAIQVQIAQVRGELMQSLGIETPGTRGRMTLAQVEALGSQIRRVIKTKKGRAILGEIVVAHGFDLEQVRKEYGLKNESKPKAKRNRKVENAVENLPAAA